MRQPVRERRQIVRRAINASVGNRWRARARVYHVDGLATLDATVAQHSADQGAAGYTGDDVALGEVLAAEWPDDGQLAIQCARPQSPTERRESAPIDVEEVQAFMAGGRVVKVAVLRASGWFPIFEE